MSAAALEERTANLAAVADLLCEWRDRLVRVRRGEESIPLRPAGVEKPDPLTSSTERIRQLRLLIIGPTPQELTAAGYTRNVATAAEAITALAVETIDVVIVPDDEVAEALAACGHPVVVDYIEQRSFLRSRAYGARAVASIAKLRKGGGS